MKNNKEKQSQYHLDGVMAALQRAAETARRIAAQTQTPLVVYENGKVVLKEILPHKPLDSVKGE